ncbi:MAG TPA: SDR family NAD(P)-dependent oxidoreductase [Phycisphaerae bacterium]|nr:SDR family NAD(P)-dependent oxidoreductase [Phycisphaerae bacterium]HOM50979.1 SDR family NAD(P)-dependent oxidoreductase [Phycisphaerae bacterium]HON66436.1 SDR family NAD(P)-dependent oxidoreductase [Phycisphaerae bacterium]HOQ86404.1 SDR family NAD(P)-dependent oxidoreductase [Phycisphaerae bacterium]HPU28036.1 SDR family NAD(P)-dependent oxidoreductase [Phycisphaerae bacterium]
MPRHVLITGGAGFIGSHLADDLIEHGYEVRVLDNLTPQVHGPEAEYPASLNPAVEFMRGDVRNPNDVRRALEGIDAMFHLAAAVGVGQSMYEVAHYISVNTHGTAVLLEGLLQHPVERLVVASSMSIYGEGLYRSADGQNYIPASRPLEQLKAGAWELRDTRGAPLVPIPTPESKPPELSSVYALTKSDQERLCLMLGRAYSIPTVALRFFNVYGPRQALSNPYTGVLAIFASRLLNNRPPLIFEDGNQMRDFVSVRDVAMACRLALTAPEAPGRVFNIGSGRPFSIREIARKLAAVLGRNSTPVITGKYRMGDIRHCFADITQAKQILGYSPRVNLEAGLVDLAQWLEGQSPCDRVEEAATELESRGLTV